MKDSNIEWTDHTFNPWIGCTKVSPGCLYCYAATQDKFRNWTPEGWGAGKPRKRTSAAYWNQPIKWAREAAAAFRRWETCIKELFEGDEAKALAAGYTKRARPRVFCASLADWLDDEVPIEWLADLLSLIHATPDLDWQLLTKRPQSWKIRVWAAGDLIRRRGGNDRWLFDWCVSGIAPQNVWIGTSVEDQPRADERIPNLLNIPARVRFLSCEPLLGEVSLATWLGREPRWKPYADLIKVIDPEGGVYYRRGIHWVIVGGESGPDARPMHPGWSRSLRDQCKAEGVAFFFKQWGEYVTADMGNIDSSREERFVEMDGTDSTGWTIDRHSVSTCMLARIGKKAAGCDLDGREWKEFPSS